MTKKYDIIEVFRLSFSLAKVTFRLRVEGSYLGIFWYLLNPLFLFGILMLVRETSFVVVDISFYAVYLFLGIVGFNFFKSAISSSIDAISSNSGYIKSINKVSPASLVVAAVLQTIFAHIFEVLIIACLIFYFSLPALGLVYYVFIFIWFAILTLGLSFIFAVVGAHVSDLDNVWSIVAQLLFLATPIFYVATPGSLIYKLNIINPLFYFLETVRPLLIYGHLPSTDKLIIFFAGAPLSLLIGIIIFERNKHKLAELV